MSITLVKPSATTYSLADLVAATRQVLGSDWTDSEADFGSYAITSDDVDVLVEMDPEGTVTVWAELLNVATGDRETDDPQGSCSDDHRMPAPDDVPLSEAAATLAATVLAAVAELTTTAGDILLAALTQTGMAAYPSDGPESNIAMPIWPATPPEQVLNGVHVLIADQAPTVEGHPADHRGWLAVAHDANGEPVAEVYDGTRAELDCAADSAACAAAVAHWLSR